MPSPQALAMYEALLHPQARGAGAGDHGRGHPGSDRAAARARRPRAGRARRTRGRAGHAGAAVGAGDCRESTEAGVGPSHDQARVVVLAGDAGVGKTRLAAELARRVHLGGAVVLAGRSPEESLLPYQPFLEALRHYVVHAPLDELRRTAREYGAELARLVPELRRRAPELISRGPGRPRDRALPPLRGGRRAARRDLAQGPDPARPRRPALGRSSRPCCCCATWRGRLIRAGCSSSSPIARSRPRRTGWARCSPTCAASSSSPSCASAG